MTIIQKLSDRDSFIYEAISLCLVNMGNLNLQRLQWQLFQAGVYIKKPLLEKAIEEMKAKGLVGKPEPKKIATPTLPKIIMP